MQRKGLHVDRQGVAGAVATMFVLLIVLAFINLYVIGYVPSTVRQQEFSHMSAVYTEFSEFRLQSYNLESGSWQLPASSTFIMGSNGYAPFAPPTTGHLVFSNAQSIVVSFPLGVPLYVPTPSKTVYNTSSGINGAVQYGTQPPGYTSALVLNGSYNHFNVNVGSTTSVDNFTLIIKVNGDHNTVNIYANGNGLDIWYISYGADNALGTFSLTGTGNHGYVQTYGLGDTAPPGWPHFQSVQQGLIAGGSLSLSVPNQYYTPQEFVFEDGSIIENQSGGAIMLDGPQLTATNASDGAALSLNLVSLLGQPFSASGSGPAVVSTSYYSNQSFQTGSYAGMNVVSSITLTVSSDYASAWASFFSSSLSSLQNVTNDPSLAQTQTGGTAQHVSWGAYSLTDSGGKVILTIYNLESMHLTTGSVMVSA